MPQSLANFDAALKDNYGPGLRNAINNSNPVFTEIMRNDEDIQGRQAVWTVHTSRSGSTGNRAELAALPVADRQRYTQVRDDLAFFYHTVKVSGQAKHLTQNDSAAFTKALEAELDGAETDLKTDVSRQAFGTVATIGGTVYTGVIASVTSVSSATITLGTVADDEVALTKAEMRYFFVGEPISVINGTTGAVRGTANVTAVTAATPSITLDAVIAGVADEDYIVRQGNLGNELNGLRFLINATSVYANVDPATVPNWAALTVGSSTTPVSEVLFDQASEKPGTDGDGSNPSLYIVEQDQRRKLASQLQAQKRYDGKQSTLKGGWKGLDLEYGTLVADRFCPSNDGFAINPEKIARFVGLDFTWDDDDGKILYKALDGSDAVEARYKAYINLETPVRNAHTRITFSTATF